jgi:hypothetical protein
MRDLDAAEIAAIAARAVVARDLVWITAKDRSTGDPVSRGFWNEVRTQDITVRDGRTGALVSRTFVGIGRALAIGAIPLTADISVRDVEIALPHLDATVALLVRGYDVRNAALQVYRGYFDPATRTLVAPPKPRFVGAVDGAPIATPKAGEEGAVTLRCVSTTRELTRTNPEVRSHASQQARTAGADDFYIDTGVVGEWEMFWGRNRGPVVAGSALAGMRGQA